MDNEQKQKLVEATLRVGDSRIMLKQALLRWLAETNERMLAEGVPAEVIAICSARALGRLQGPSMTEIGKSLIPVEPMPEGALSFYLDGPVKSDE